MRNDKITKNNNIFVVSIYARICHLNEHKFAIENTFSMRNINSLCDHFGYSKGSAKKCTLFLNSNCDLC